MKWFDKLALQFAEKLNIDSNHLAQSACGLG